MNNTLAEYAYENQHSMAGFGHMGDQAEELVQQFDALQVRLNELNFNPLARTTPFNNRLAEVQRIISAWLPRIITLDATMLVNAQGVVDGAYTNLDQIATAMAEVQNRGATSIAVSTYKPTVVQTVTAPARPGGAVTVSPPRNQPVYEQDEVVVTAKKYGPWAIAGVAALAFLLIATSGKRGR